MERFRGTPQLQITRRVPRYKHQGPTTKDKLARIDHLSRTARQHWLVLITFLGFVTVTLFGVEHIDFFLPSRKTDLPLIGVSIPTAYFFYCAPILVTLLFCYLHVHLMKLWKEMTIHWCEEHGPLGDKLPSWLVSDLVIWARQDLTKDPIPLQQCVNTISGFVIFWATPLILSAFWWKSMPAHEEWMTLAIAACFVVSCVFASKSRRFFKLSLANKKPLIGNALWVICVSVLILAVIAISWLRTERGFYKYYEEAWSLGDPLIQGWLPLADTDISNQYFITIPSWWDSYDNLKSKFYKKNCLDKVDKKSCFSQWDQDYKGMLGRIHKLDLQNIDARGANISYSYLVRADLSRAKLQGAHLSWSELQGADLYRAQLQEANLSRAQLQGANFTWAELQEANLSEAQLQGANLRWAELQGANLGEAKLQGANLSEAQLQGVNLRWAELQGANLTWAELQGADLYRAQFEGADLNSAQFEGADLSEAQLQGVNLIGANLEGVDLRRAQLQGANLTWAQLHGANLTWAELQGADLHQTQLQGADLHEAQLQGADLQEAQLQGANLSGANLSGAQLQGADLSGSILVNLSGLTQKSVQFALAQNLNDQKTMLPLVPMSDTFEFMKIKQCYSFLDLAYLRSTYCHFCYNGMDITTFEQRLEKFACPLTESD